MGEISQAQLNLFESSYCGISCCKNPARTCSPWHPYSTMTLRYHTLKYMTTPLFARELVLIGCLSAQWFNGRWYNFIVSFTSTQDLEECDFLPYTSYHVELHVSLYAEVHKRESGVSHYNNFNNRFPEYTFSPKKEKKCMSLLFVPQNKINFLYIFIFCFLLQIHGSQSVDIHVVQLYVPFIVTYK